MGKLSIFCFAPAPNASSNSKQLGPILFIFLPLSFFNLCLFVKLLYSFILLKLFISLKESFFKKFSFDIF